MDKILITGIAGFIGTHLNNHLSKFNLIYGLDSLSADKPASLQRAKLISSIFKGSIHDRFLDVLEEKPKIVIHLAAETGIPGSLNNPTLYFQQNVEGTFNVLEQCRKNGVKYLIYASSSSVYEPNQSIMSEDAPHDKQLSFYGTSKRMTEVMVDNYCRQFGMTAIGLRFFTVYGSWTRMDMAAYKFMSAIEEGKSIILYNEGNIYRDFTHVSDIVHAIHLLANKIQQETSGFHEVFNIGHGSPISVLEYAETIAKNMDKSLRFDAKPLPFNELSSTYSDTTKLQNYIHFAPEVGVEEGVKEMTKWYLKSKYV